MTKIDNFKSFVRRNPNLITYVREKNTSWQEFYELYDLYGEDPTIWNKYLNKEEKGVKESSNNNPLNNILRWLRILMLINYKMVYLQYRRLLIYLGSSSKR